MKLLLDSQAFIYLVNQPERLPAAACRVIQDLNNIRFLSIASPLELQIKVSIGKLSFAKPVRDLVQFELDRGAMELLPITLNHIDELSRLPMHHKDPFDRILIAQARAEGLTIITGDRTIPRYPVTTLWE
ncbi:MAG TPA: type II toxin-antitoxin system VapC family toxin [Humisphaera sp.]|jgi:PIN domain nuclease of toxin-antitoxin system|nr:type II toxin-antitoxin system VapC family toxin [Humisphaera sp.]